MRDTYPELRIYSFDTNLDLSAIDTLKSMYKIDSRKLPAIVYGDDAYTGFKSVDEVKEIIPQLKKLDAEKARAEKMKNTASTTASSTTVR
jgi:hypothetical protein